jgi:hypothetical protein
MSSIISDSHRYFIMVEKKAEEVKLILIKNFPLLPLKIIDNVINETTCTVLLGCQVIRFEFDNFYEIALKNIKRRKEEAIDVLEMLLNNHNELIDNRCKEINTEIINNLKIILNSTNLLWSEIN